jgi:hypothetical protein
VPTAVAFRTVLQAQRARQVMNETWRYDAWGQVIVMMPLKNSLPRINQPALPLDGFHPPSARHQQVWWMQGREENTTLHPHIRQTIGKDEVNVYERVTNS